MDAEAIYVLSVVRLRSAYALRSISRRWPIEAVPMHLLRGAGEQHSEQLRRRSIRQHLVPTLEDGGLTLGQSLAIIEYLEQTHPTPALLPQEPSARARVRELALSVACDIHPLNNTARTGLPACAAGTRRGATQRVGATLDRRWDSRQSSSSWPAATRTPVSYCLGEAPTHRRLLPDSTGIQRATA